MKYRKNNDLFLQESIPESKYLSTFYVFNPVLGSIRNVSKIMQGYFCLLNNKICLVNHWGNIDLYLDKNSN